MFSKFWQRRVPNVHKSLLKLSDFEYEDTGILPNSIVGFVNRMMQTALYKSDELPLPSMQIYFIDYYHTQVCNGGHTQFIFNSGWSPEMISYIQSGLEILDVAEASAIFSELVDFSHQEPERFKQIARNGNAEIPDPFTDALNRRFYTGSHAPSETLPLALQSWIRTLPEIEIISDDLFESRLADLIAANPLRKARLKESRKATEKARQEDPIVQAMTALVKIAGRQGLEFVNWRAAHHEKQEDGRYGWLAYVNTSLGSAIIYFSPDSVVFWMDGEETPCAHVRLDEMESYVLKKTGKSLRMTIRMI